MKHLRSIAELGMDGALEVFRRADLLTDLLSGGRRDDLRGCTVATVFFESSTRTQLSFEAAAQRMGADLLRFNEATSSTNKGESLRDTLETIDAMGCDIMVLRHPDVGAPWLASRWVRASLVNAGDGSHEHPTQALLDVYTVRNARPGRRFDGMRLGIVGDVRHSRTARSDVALFSLLGAQVTLIGTPALLPSCLHGWAMGSGSLDVDDDLDAVLPKLDVVMTLRVQDERMGDAVASATKRTVERYCLTEKRAAMLSTTALILDPGPTSRGLAIASSVADSQRSMIRTQVANGVLIRAAVMQLLSSERYS